MTKKRQVHRVEVYVLVLCAVSRFHNTYLLNSQKPSMSSNADAHWTRPHLMSGCGDVAKVESGEINKLCLRRIRVAANQG